MLTIIEGAHLYNPEDLGIQDIVLCAERIVAVGQDLSSLYPCAQRFDAQGLLAVPGYLDQHVHIIGGGGKGGFQTRIPELNLKSCIEAGVTTLVGVMGTDGSTKNIENLVAKTKALNEQGLTAYCLTGSYEYPSITLTGDLKKDIVFIEEILGVKIAISDHRSSYPTKAELIRLISEVHLAALLSGKPGLVTIHVGQGKGGLDLLFEILRETDLPIDHLRPTHLGKHEQQAVEFAKLGGYIDYTATSNYQEVAAEIVSALKMGAPAELITLSSDANGSFPSEVTNETMQAAPMTSLHGVIRALVQTQGFSLSTALAFVTSNVAQALALGHKKGWVKPGYDGDLLLLNENLSINTVIARGNIFKQNCLLKFV